MRVGLRRRLKGRRKTGLLTSRRDRDVTLLTSQRQRDRSKGDEEKTHLSQKYREHLKSMYASSALALSLSLPVVHDMISSMFQVRIISTNTTRRDILTIYMFLITYRSVSVLSCRKVSLKVIHFLVYNLHDYIACSIGRSVCRPYS